MTRDTILLWLSSGKPITAVALAKQWEAGLLDLDDPVVAVYSGICQPGEGRDHGSASADAPSGIRGMNFSNDLPWDEIIARTCRAD